ncbi:LytTR family DNA-binding domain-containing protein [Fulvivirgaceae bacterium BMA10]|uniref:LytTR family DNA-binding domain-containing protein n=1 Tax=Splendidivirga corallicola TaxID=3051826 RepID=A0ABT8KY04_9BACT|nr:LytTR family DNA-binding domain-containing protein [Fulvivirgaceae bacterium BMA10]
MDKKLKCIIIDDDPISQKIVEGLVQKTESLELEGIYDNPISAVEVIKEENLDLLFLDVEMPDMTGLEMLGTLKNSPKVIIISSKDKYAIDAFDYDVVDYLVKPIENYARFLKAVNRVFEKQDAPKSEKDNIFIKVDSLLVNFDLQDIIRVEAYGDYVKIYTEDKTHTVYNTLKTVAEKLPSDEFIRIHRSHIVRIDKIKNIDNTNLEIHNKILPISTKYKSDLLKRIKVL